MNPDEAWIGKVFFVGIVGLVIWGITALLQAKSEAARRARVVLGATVGLGVTWVIFAVSGPLGVLTAAAVIGATVWIVKGSKK